jgi:L-cysteine:1D-myo-inositol 2-amino-2-deoxy-alpha-D-glucopyranoside ligase
MRLFNSATNAVERFRPRPGLPVSLYVCGITPYDTTHLGHAFTYVIFDVLQRHMQVVHRWPTRYVQNVTDIDDDVLRKAAATGEDWRALGLRWTEVLRSDLGRLGLLPPEVFPGATSCIPAIIDDVTRLLALGRAYERKGSVYFRTAADGAFGELAGLPRSELLALANERGNDPADPNKDDPLDFVLWQAGRPGEPAWRSPWSVGRPGWHIECSTLATHHLGAPVDVHGGGGDLIFPHHACEIAQSEPLTGVRPWVRLWMHVAMVRMDGEKMSKSLGNLVLVRDLLASHEADTIRLYLLSHHWRSAWEWSRDQFEACDASREALHAAMRRASGSGRELDFTSFGPRATAALDNDLDTPAAVATLLDLADAILGAPAGADVRGAQDVLEAVGHRILGLWLRPLDDVPPAEKAPWPEPLVAPPDVVLPGALAH